MRHLATLIGRRSTKDRKLIRFFSSSNPAGNGIRVAIIGGGVSGLSTALQLAPLVEKGLIAEPIEIYERSCLASSPDVMRNTDSGKDATNSTHSAGSGAIGRDIGVGIWSTALEPFRTHRTSYKELIQKLEHLGQYVEKVGYRTPKGDWLTKTKLSLPSSLQPNLNIDDLDAAQTSSADPSLLFIRENDFIKSLHEAAIAEQEKGTIQLHYATDGQDESTHVDSIVLPDITKNGSVLGYSGQLQFKDGSISSTDYHMVISADGMKSTLRTQYSGYDCFIKKWKAGIEPSLKGLTPKWKDEQLAEKLSIEDRNYVVFRGITPLKSDGVSFQTWGEGRNMRFALVGMSHPTNDKGPERSEKQVWFATICDEIICSKKDPEERKELLVKSFQEWHDPIRQLIESTPAEEILMERGVGHKHSLQPVLNLAEVMHYQACHSEMDNAASISPIQYPGPGCILLFAGDAYMTVDPVLAQGFTIGMEAASDLAVTLESCLGQNGKDHKNSQQPFDSKIVREALLERNHRRFGRVMCLIRSTELVQSLAQPNSEFAGILTKNFVRPAMALVPSFIKEAAFSVVMKYSLGYYGNYTKVHADTDRTTTRKNND
jgi:2-polyprenyl-6-methoxyphenol hydroxylase-like FAD-dependent oxidoreductase